MKTLFITILLFKLFTFSAFCQQVEKAKFALTYSYPSHDSYLKKFQHNKKLQALVKDELKKSHFFEEAFNMKLVDLNGNIQGLVFSLKNKIITFYPCIRIEKVLNSNDLHKKSHEEIKLAFGVEQESLNGSNGEVTKIWNITHDENDALSLKRIKIKFSNEPAIKNNFAKILSVKVWSCKLTKSKGVSTPKGKGVNP